MTGFMQVVGSFALFIALLWTGMPSFPTPEAHAERATYTLTDFEITYPYDDPRSDVPPSSRLAEVTYRIQWPSDGYPGNANCHLRLAGSEGQMVGSLRFGLDSASNDVHTRGMKVPVKAPPVSATGSCEPGDPYLPGPGYFFEGPTSVSEVINPTTGEVVPGRTELTFQVSWERPEISPGFRQCQLIVSRTDGTEDPPLNFGVAISEGPETLNVAADPTTVEDARVTCRSL